MGGVCFPLLSDFNPKGQVAARYGAYLDEAGITDRATVLVDAGGTVQHASSVGPAGKRDPEALLALAREVDAAYSGPTEDFAQPLVLPPGSILYVKSPCIFSRWALAARANLHLDALEVRNVSEDATAREDLERRGGKHQAPALLLDGEVQYESGDIIKALGTRYGVL